MSDDTTVHRTVDTDLDAADLWALVGDGDGWAAWMVDEADVDVRPGEAARSSTTASRARCASIGSDGARRVGFTWWPDDRPELVSAVELIVAAIAGGSTCGSPRRIGVRHHRTAGVGRPAVAAARSGARTRSV